MTLTEALEIAVRTDPGLVRPHNEDAVFGDATLGLAILADVRTQLDVPVLTANRNRSMPRE